MGVAPPTPPRPDPPVFTHVVPAAAAPRVFTHVGRAGPVGFGGLALVAFVAPREVHVLARAVEKNKKKNPKIKKKKRAMRSSAPPGCPLSSPSSQTHGLGHFQSPARCWPPPPLGKPPRLPPPEPLLPPPKPPRPMGPGKGGVLGFFGVKKRDFGDARTLPRHPHPGSPYLLGRGRPGRPLRRG